MMKLNDIRKYWENVSENFPLQENVTPTSRDPHLALLERKNILDFLKSFHTTLELGCGDGSHTIHYAKKVKKLLALDIAKPLISIAQKRAVNGNINNIDFINSSVLKMKNMYPSQKFTCVISQRCLINLPQWKYQQKAILQVHNLLNEEGLFLVTEGFQNELDNLNVVRQQLGLPKINVVNYNKNFKREDFEGFVKQFFDIIEVRHYGIYLFLSRIFHPLAVLPEQPQYNTKLNKIAMEISTVAQIHDLEKYSYNLFYALKKKSN